MSLKDGNGRMLVEVFQKPTLQSFTERVRSCALVRKRHVYARILFIKFIKSRLVSGRCSTLSAYDRLQNKI